MNNVNWEPWKEYADDAEILPIEEPPCKYCIFWHPHREYNSMGSFTGIRCCTSYAMHHDFSCYSPRIFVSE